MLLAGILLKMGGYALIRMNAQMLPDAYFAPVLVILYHLCCPDIVCPAQPEAQITYSSISHMGFCAGRIFYRFGLEWGSAANGFPRFNGASLFFLGTTYDRTHTLMLDEMGGVGRSGRLYMFHLFDGFFSAPG